MVEEREQGKERVSQKKGILKVSTGVVLKRTAA